MDKKLSEIINQDIKNNYFTEKPSYFCDKYNISLSSVQTRASKLKVTNKFHLESIKNLIIDEYVNNGLGLGQLQEKYGHYAGTYKKFLINYGIKLKTQSEWSKRYHFDDKFFKKIDSHEKAYWLGFIYADGNISSKKSGKVFQIALANKDGEHVERLKKSLKSSHKTYKDRNSLRLMICQNEIYNDLKNLGVDERKSLTIKPPSEDQVPKKYLNSFFLGFFDGDGSIYIYKPRKTWHFQIIATKCFCEAFQNFLIENGISGGTLRKELRVDEHKDVWYYNIGGGYATDKGKEKINHLYNVLYANNDIFLERKRDRFLFMLNEPLEFKKVGRKKKV